MALLTIGAFAQETGLTPKALRIYADLGLLPPAAVDAESGYRLYDPRQLALGRLIAQLRRIDMPLADVRAVCALEPPAAAAAIDAYWQRVSAETASRGRLARVLVEHMSGGGAAVPENRPALALLSAAACETGAVRTSNEDAAYAGTRLIAVADGVGGAGGAAASATAIEELQAMELADVPARDTLCLLADAVVRAHRAVRAAATEPAQPFTTLTALTLTGCQVALVHIGDGRAHLWRDGELFVLTKDHTVVQGMVDRGELRADRAAVHPDRAFLVRALGAGTGGPEADLALRSTQVGDRYLLCTDGLSAVVPPAGLSTALRAATDPADAVQRLTALATAASSPDNLSVVVADVVAA